jgi:hypothetical protein
MQSPRQKPAGIEFSMRRGSLLWLFLVASCGGAGLGDVCSTTDECSSTLQCVSGVCRPRCERAPDCGDGFACGADGICRTSDGVSGDNCDSEVDCGPGLACELGILDDNGQLSPKCAPTAGGHPAGATCNVDTDCRNHTCALGHCIDLCSDTRDCGVGTGCANIPRIESGGVMFAGCLQSAGSLAWNIQVHGSADTVKLPIPDTARSVAVTMQVDDTNQMVGVTHLGAPDGIALLDYNDDPFSDLVRHRPALAQSVLAMPSSPEAGLVPGAYTLDIRALKPPFTSSSIGTATPVVTAVVKLDSSVILDLHFYFLNFDDHPCSAKFDNGVLDAATAAAGASFQNSFLGTMRQVFSHGNVALGTLTYEDLRDHPDLDGLAIANAPALLALGTHAVGVNVFFVRSMSPIGLQAFGPNPGPAGLAKTPQSGVIVSLDSLCYRSWQEVARLTAHEVARYMGLYDNVGIDPAQADPIEDSDTASSNLMFYSELGGADLSPGQRDILSRSAVLR